MVDYYEFLQISPNADADTIHRVYRFLAARFHPDNPGSGDPEQFCLLKSAYEVLSDRVRRAEYDASRKRRPAQPFSSSVDFMDSMEGELNRRLAVLAVLYHKRRANASYPEVSLAQIEDRMGFPRDYLEFTLWYLLKKGYVSKGDNAQYTLTADGVDFVEANRVDFPILNKMLTSGREPTVEEIDPHEEEAAAGWKTQTEPAEAFSASGAIILPSSSDVSYDRRSDRPDRRVGAADLRWTKTERRKGSKDRRTERKRLAAVN
jgi:curved DNA-binding protein CbpA